MMEIVTFEAFDLIVIHDEYFEVDETEEVEDFVDLWTVGDVKDEEA